MPRAQRELADIRSYIGADDEEATRLVMHRIINALKLIMSRPHIGRPTLDPRVREWSVPGLPYVIPCRVRGDVVEILRGFHISRQRPSKWIG